MDGGGCAEDKGEEAENNDGRVAYVKVARRSLLENVKKV